MIAPRMFYRTRSGSIVYILTASCPKLHYPIVGYDIHTGEVYSWTNCGQFNIEKTSHLDLISEAKYW